MIATPLDFLDLVKRLPVGSRAHLLIEEKERLLKQIEEIDEMLKESE